MGIFGYDTNNALAFPLLNADIQSRIIEAFSEFDHEAINLNALIQRINSLQVSEHDSFGKAWDRDFPRGKRTGFNLNKAGDLSGRVELRAVRPQASADVWVNQIRLLHKRIMYLRKKTEPLPIRLVVPVITSLKLTFEDHLLNPPVNPQQALHAFHVYLSEAGERWEDHRSYLWPKWISNGEVSRYEKSESFRKVKAMGCAEQLERVPQ